MRNTLRVWRKEKRRKKGRKAKNSPRSSKRFEWNLSGVIPTRYVRSFSDGLVHPHTNLFQFSDFGLFICKKVKFLKDIIKFLIGCVVEVSC